MMEVGQILRRLRTEQNLTLQEVALRAKTTKSQVDKLERGERRLTVEWLERLAAALGVNASSLLQGVTEYPMPEVETPPHLADSVKPSFEHADKLPLYGQAQWGRAGLKDMETVLGYVHRPPLLEGVLGAFAVHMPDESMQPRFNAGDLLFLNPTLPILVRQSVLIQDHNHQGMIGILESMNGQECNLSSLNNTKEWSLSYQAIKRISRVVGVWYA
jgi:transcriptional regulator with XRE-family HTH domain